MFILLGLIVAWGVLVWSLAGAFVLWLVSSISKVDLEKHFNDDNDDD